MNYPPWASWANAATQKKKALPNPPYLQYLRGQSGSLAPYRPAGLGNVVPSVQQFSRANPSEQKGYAGWLNDEMGLPPEDVFWLMNRLAPRGYTAGPRWAGR